VTELVVADPELRSASAQTWPAIEREQLGEWQLRASRGYTGRANSVLVSGDPGLPIAAAADRAVAFYESRGLPVLAQIVISSVQEQALRGLGWVEARPGEADCWVMTRPEAETGQGEPLVRLDEALSPAWLSARFPAGIPDGAPEVLGGGRHVFASVVGSDGRIVGLGRGAVSAGYVGLSCLWIEESQRRKGLGTQMMSALVGWGSAVGASTAFLEVLDDNVAARQVYRRSGFVDRYAYRYLTVHSGSLLLDPSMNGESTPSWARWATMPAAACSRSWR